MARTRQSERYMRPRRDRSLIVEEAGVDVENLVSRRLKMAQKVRVEDLRW